MGKSLDIIKRVQEHLKYLKDKGYEVVFIALQGSQNYGLDLYNEKYKSDVDTKAVVLPSFDDFIRNKTPISTTLVLENNEHIDVKDIRVMFNTYKKQNTNYIETLFTKYKIINVKYMDLIQPIFDNNEEIAHININQALRCMAGMSIEKLKAMEHSYPTIIDKIEKYGYDPKQLHHIVRMNDFIKNYVSGKKYAECLIPKDEIKSFLLDIKIGKYDLESARKIATTFDNNTKKIKDENILEKDEINQNAIEILEKVKSDILKKRFREELK